jgi:plastocyanin
MVAAGFDHIPEPFLSLLGFLLPLILKFYYPSIHEAASSMSQPKGSVGVALTVTVLIIISVTSVGYYQYVYCASNSCTTSASTTSAVGLACAPPKCVTILINFGAAGLTTTAFSPDVAKLVIGLNNTFQFLNNDSQSGGVAHTATVKTCPQNCAFDTGIIAYNETKGPYTITTPGTYAYFCSVHPTTMVGTIVVVAGSGGGAGATSSSSSVSSTTSSSSAVPANALPISIPKGAGGNSSSTAPISGYRPGNVTIVIGTNNTLTWTNDDISPHTVTSVSVPGGAATFNSGIISAGQTWSITFNVPGTYQYNCALHAWMKGVVIVKSG